jgi:hypothetical protein
MESSLARRKHMWKNNIQINFKVGRCGLGALGSAQGLVVESSGSTGDLLTTWATINFSENNDSFVKRSS